MPDVTTADPDFRAWLDSLKVPSFLDKDALLAAGVIDDDVDWLLWRDRGWLAFIVKASGSQQMALFEMLRREAGRRIAPTPDQRERSAMTWRCHCLQCSLRRLALENAANEDEAMADVAIVLGRMLAKRDEETFAAVTAEVTRSRDFYRDEAAERMAKMEVAGHA